MPRPRNTSRPVVRLLKQLLLLALPLILDALRQRKAQRTAASTPPRGDLPASRPPRADTTPKTASPVGELHRRRRSDVVVTDTGLVVKVLPDDNDGSRHQRFLVEVDHTDVTIKIAHNIDLAPRVPAREGDRLRFRGEYEYNDLGGALHWTHHDPKRWREGGWIELDGQRYE
ncbi:MAG: DUF3465 domain-containing protein [Planctomycetota bacterium]